MCGVAVVLGSILPWGTLELAGVGSMTLDGLDRDGSLTLVLGLAAIGVLIVSIAIGAVWPVVVGGGLFLITSIVSVINISDIRTLGGFDLTNSVEVGIGLWLVLAASVTGMILCGVGFVKRQV